MNNTLEVVAESDAPPIETLDRADLPVIWEGYRSQLETLKATASTLVVTDESQVAQMELARTTRLALKKLRCAIEARRKELGEDYLRKTQKINASAKELKDLIEPLELRMEEQEKFAEVQQAKRIAALKLEREAILSPLGVNVTLYSLGEMKPEEFEALLEGTKAAIAAKEEAARKAEAERIAKEKADAEERERLRIENERLMKEAAERERAAAAERKHQEGLRAAAEEKARKEREAIEAKAKAEREAAAKLAAEAEAKAKAERDALEAKAKAEREAAEAAAKKEREAREKIEAELRAKAEAEEAERKAKAAAEKKAAAAPDKEKLIAFAALVRALAQPVCKTPEGESAAKDVADKTEKFAAWVEKQAEAL